MRGLSTERVRPLILIVTGTSEQALLMRVMSVSSLWLAKIRMESTGALLAIVTPVPTVRERMNVNINFLNITLQS